MENAAKMTNHHVYLLVYLYLFLTKQYNLITVNVKMFSIPLVYYLVVYTTFVNTLAKEAFN